VAWQHKVFSTWRQRIVAKNLEVSLNAKQRTCTFSIYLFTKAKKRNLSCSWTIAAGKNLSDYRKSWGRFNVKVVCVFSLSTCWLFLTPFSCSVVPLIQLLPPLEMMNWVVARQVVGHWGHRMMCNEGGVCNERCMGNNWSMVNNSWCSHVMRVGYQWGVVAQTEVQATFSLDRWLGLLLLLRLLLGNGCGQDAGNANDKQN